MRTITQEEFDNLPVIDGYKLCPGNTYYSNINFGLRCKFGSYCEFGSNSIFGSCCKFDSYCNFGSYCLFGSECKFGLCCKIGSCCIFGSDCNFGSYCKIGSYCKFGSYCNFGSECKIGSYCKFDSECNFGLRCKFGSNCEFTIINATFLLFNFEMLSDELTLEMMRRDAEFHPNPEKFDKWVKTDICPYQDCNFHRLFIFQEKKNLWKPGKPEMTNYELITKIFEYKNWKLIN
jgi:hypothetical protein